MFNLTFTYMEAVSTVGDRLAAHTMGHGEYGSSFSMGEQLEQPAHTSLTQKK